MLRARAQHLAHVFFRPMWSWGWLGVVGVVSGLAWVRDEFAPAGLQTKLKAVTFLPSWGWESWGLMWSAAFLVVLFEGSYRHARTLHAEIDKERSRADTYWEGIERRSGDVPIEDVFYWIDPGVIEDQTWEAIGAELIDKLHIGQLRVWGRPISQQGHIGPLGQIPAINWSTLKFSYMFFMPDSGQTPHTFHPTPGGTQHTGLVFNAGEIEAHWPAPPNRRS